MKKMTKFSVIMIKVIALNVVLKKQATEYAILIVKSIIISMVTVTMIALTMTVSTVFVILIVLVFLLIG